ncbi:MAG: hypothetical protein COA78_07700 [Blastopirellula sp.]|nr:MAG: hypothetical protein COA78_07700 [Blastopirellula sp.]
MKNQSQIQRTLLITTCIVFAGCLTATAGTIPPPNPNIEYLTIIHDAVTGDDANIRDPTDDDTKDNGGRFEVGNMVYWDVDKFQPGGGTQRADDYGNETYERPTDSDYYIHNDSGDNQRFAAETNFYENLDIVTAGVAIDDIYLYVQINLFGEYTENNSGERQREGLAYNYGFRIGVGEIGEDPDTYPNGGHLIRAVGPANKDSNPSSWALNASTDIYLDADAADAANSGITKTEQSDPGEKAGNGYDLEIAADGVGKKNDKGPFKVDGDEVLYTRLVEDTTPENHYIDNNIIVDNSIIEFAVNYSMLGYTRAELESERLFLLFEAHQTQSVGNYFWNDQSTEKEAGTPNYDLAIDDAYGFDSGGLESIYELDTLRFGGFKSDVVPEPASIAVWSLLSILGLGYSKRRKKAMAN